MTSGWRGAAKDAARGVGGRKKLPHSWHDIILFLAGSVAALFGYDWTDYVNYWAQAHGVALSPAMQAFYFAIFPTLFYAALAGIAFLVARTGVMGPLHFVEALVILVFVVPGILGLLLPQAFVSPVFWMTVAGGTLVSTAIGVGLFRQVKRDRR